MLQERLQMFLLVIQLILALGNVCVMLYALTKFIEKPHDTLEGRVTALEEKVKAMDNSLQNGSGHFKDLDESSEVILKSTLALLDAVMQMAAIENKTVSEDLRDARKNLKEFLVGR